MKTLILVLFAIAIFSFGINAQDLSFKTFNQTIKPKGELFAKFENADTAFYVFNEWEDYSITQWQVTYNKNSQEVWELRKYKFFYDEINHDFNKVELLDQPNYYKGQISVKLQGKESKYALITEYGSSSFKDYGIFIGYFYAQNEAQAKSFIEKLKEKAFDMSLDLDAKVERFSIGDEVRIYNEEYPSGISAAELRAMEMKKEAEQTAETKSKVADEDSTESKSVNFVTVNLKHTGGERYYLSIIGEENEKCRNEVFSFTHSKYGEETRRYTFCEGQKLIEKNTGRVIFTATKAMNGTTFKIN